MQTPSTHLSLLSALAGEQRREEAWAAFQARYRDVLLRWCRRRQLSGSCAEDLTQEVLLKLFQELSRGRYDPVKGRFRGWLKSIVNNAITDCWRRQQRRPEQAAVGGSTFLERLASHAGPEAAEELSGEIEQQTRVAAAEIVRRVRDRLEETTWQAFYQTTVEDRPPAEVAAALGLTVWTVYKAKARVKEALLEESREVHTTAGDAVVLSRREAPPETPS